MQKLTTFERAGRYLSRMSPAVSGAGGHSTTFHAACTMANGFGMSEAETLMLMQDWNRQCQPPRTEAELRHKVADAMRASCPSH